MQYSVIFFFLVSFLSACVFALPTASSAEDGAAGRTSRFVARGVRRLDARQDNTQQQQTGASQGANNTAAGRNGVSDAQVMNAVMSWMQDTGKVTKFLNSATSFTGAEFTKQATIALNAEIDELNHKMVLDAALTGMDMVAQANNVLATQGTFQQVVDTLQSMVSNGPDTAQKDVNSINNNRCVNVLPNIDMYFAAAGMPQIQAVRPTGCLEVEGANVTPAVPPANNGGNNGNNNGGAAAPQVTQPPAANPANNNQNQGNNNGNSNQNQNQNQNQGNGNGNTNTNNQSQGNDGQGNIGKGIGNGNNGNQNQNQNQNGNGNGNSNQNQGNGNQNQNQNQGNGNNQNQGNGNGSNQNQSQNQGNGQTNNQGNNNNGQAQNSGNRNNGNGNGVQPATLGNNGNNGNNGGNTNTNQGQRPQQQQASQNTGGNGLKPAQLGSPKPANN
ncbi:hypothetical protein CkaCkLH20_08857 [Colletotrichum karsti]|uniref:Uncharacterized protein n=1 Tax=Colletotrichum karsti TaxID=1095194 RepID=A0A9P6HYN8_9PEZI|nr:uncharacterized protein CkaCkLH20_08857 [Colletotrichum karsti]KAF9873747.1 hypothetical protein CkaCkLH20_08857 [Colletotrichum karsti]